MIGKKLRFISQLPSYTIKHTLFRILAVGFTGFLFLFLAANITQNDALFISWENYLQVILIFVIGSEINVLLDNLAEHFFPIPEKTGLRISMQLIFSTLFAWAAIFYFENIIGKENLLQEPIVRLMLVLGAIFVFILLIVSIGLRITQKWIQSVNELEELKQAKLLSEYNSLQEQLNPHFLFNNLSVLKSMIMYNQQAALDFTQNFTDVYRYVLQSRGKTTVGLKEELDFLKSYIALHTERFGEGLEVEMNILNDVLEKTIPPLSLQLLVENAIKHNVAAKGNPLQITIKSGKNSVTVNNNIQLKETFFSTRKGLDNLVKRYKYLTEKKVHISQDNNIFSVKLPLL